MTVLEDLPRRWRTNGLPGILERGLEMYWPLDLDAMPPVYPALDGTLHWLLDTPTHPVSLTRGPGDPTHRDANRAELEAIARDVRFPAAFQRFIEDPAPRRHLRSATACYLDLGQFAVRTSDGGVLVHFLSDQQWVFHWMAFVGADGSEAVVASPNPVGFDVGDDATTDAEGGAAIGEGLEVCSDSFEEFLYRFWAENEIWFRLAIDHLPVDRLPEDLLRYALAYPRDR